MIVFGAETVRELLEKIATKPYLKMRIGQRDVDEHLDVLHFVGERMQHTPATIPEVTRDRHDDYLIAYSIYAQVDFLISGDHDLLVLGEFGGVRIVSPAEFVTILDASGESEIS